MYKNHWVIPLYTGLLTQPAIVLSDAIVWEESPFRNKRLSSGWLANGMVPYSLIYFLCWPQAIPYRCHNKPVNGFTFLWLCNRRIRAAAA